MRAALYACATAADLGRTVNDEKLPELRRFAAVKDWTVAGEWTDSVPTGMGRRPGFEALCAAIAAGTIDVLVAVSISDLCWDLARGLAALQAAGIGRGVALVCLRNSFDATTTAGAMRLLDALTLVAEHRLGRQVELQRIGYLRALAKTGGAVLPGRPRTLIHDLELKELYERQGLSLRKMAKKLSRPDHKVGRDVVHRAVRAGLAAGILDAEARAKTLARLGPPERHGRPRRKRPEQVVA